MKFLQTYITRFFWLIAVLFFNIHQASAAALLRNPLSNDAKTIEDLITLIITLALRIGIPIAAIMIMYSGFLYVTARGDVKQIETANRNFFWTVIGTGVLLGAFVITSILEGTINSLR